MQLDPVNTIIKTVHLPSLFRTLSSEAYRSEPLQPLTIYDFFSSKL